jgi:hypothetical protein
MCISVLTALAGWWKRSGGSTELVHTTYGRNRVGGVTWQRNVLAYAMTGSPLPPERLQQANFYWYDGLQQNYQHQRGDLAGTAPTTPESLTCNRRKSGLVSGRSPARTG